VHTILHKGLYLCTQVVTITVTTNLFADLAVVFKIVWKVTFNIAGSSCCNNNLNSSQYCTDYRRHQERIDLQQNHYYTQEPSQTQGFIQDFI